MTHPDLVQIIQKGILKNSGGVWADVGSGDGAFTLALRDIAGRQVHIYSVDRDNDSLKRQKEHFRQQFPHSYISYVNSDFTQPLPLPPLHGILAANAIHFQRDTLKTLHHLLSYLKPGGSLIIVEYNVDIGNYWVPHPFSFHTFRSLCHELGLSQPQLLGNIPSDFLTEIYAARTTKPQ